MVKSTYFQHLDPWIYIVINMVKINNSRCVSTYSTLRGIPLLYTVITAIIYRVSQMQTRVTCLITCDAPRYQDPLGYSASDAPSVEVPLLVVESKIDEHLQVARRLARCQGRLILDGFAIGCLIFIPAQNNNSCGFSVG